MCCRKKNEFKRINGCKYPRDLCFSFGGWANYLYGDRCALHNEGKNDHGKRDYKYEHKCCCGNDRSGIRHDGCWNFHEDFKQDCCEDMFDDKFNDCNEDKYGDSSFGCNHMFEFDCGCKDMGSPL